MVAPVLVMHICSLDEGEFEGKDVMGPNVWKRAKRLNIYPKSYIQDVARNNLVQLHPCFLKNSFYSCHFNI